MSSCSVCTQPARQEEEVDIIKFLAEEAGLKHNLDCGEADNFLYQVLKTNELCDPIWMMLDGVPMASHAQWELLYGEYTDRVKQCYLAVKGSEELSQRVPPLFYMGLFAFLWLAGSIDGEKEVASSQTDPLMLIFDDMRSKAGPLTAYEYALFHMIYKWCKESKERTARFNDRLMVPSSLCKYVNPIIERFVVRKMEDTTENAMVGTKISKTPFTPSWSSFRTAIRDSAFVSKMTFTTLVPLFFQGFRTEMKLTPYTPSGKITMNRVHKSIFWDDYDDEALNEFILNINVNVNVQTSSNDVCHCVFFFIFWTVVAKFSEDFSEDNVLLPSGRGNFNAMVRGKLQPFNSERFFFFRNEDADVDRIDGVEKLIKLFNYISYNLLFPTEASEARVKVLVGKFAHINVGDPTDKQDTFTDYIFRCCVQLLMGTLAGFKVRKGTTISKQMSLFNLDALLEKSIDDDLSRVQSLHNSYTASYFYNFILWWLNKYNILESKPLRRAA